MTNEMQWWEDGIMEITEDKLEKLKADLRAYIKKGKVRLTKCDYFAVNVIVNGKHFGIWDIPKSTFVA